MARSIRSKKGMALRRIKRVRYGKKELFRLNKMLGIPNKDDKSDNDIEMVTEEDEKKGLTSKDYKLLKSIVKDGSDSEDSDVGKALEEVMVMTSSKFLRKKCEARRHTENKRQVAQSNAAEVIAADNKSTGCELSVNDAVRQKRRKEAVELVNDFGSYPKWMNQKKIQALAKVNRSMKKKKNKRLQQLNRKRPLRLPQGLGSDSEPGEEEEKDEDSAPEENGVNGLEMETDTAEDSLTATNTSVKAIASLVKEAEKKQKGKKVKKGKNKVAAKNAEDSKNTEDAVETIDLSD